VLQPKAEQLFHNDSYAYRPGRSVAMALDKVKERVAIGLFWLVDADIQAFFDSIPITSLSKQLDNFIKDTDTMQLVKKWLKQGVFSSSLLSRPRGILQGSILSPLFCNIYLNQFDQAMERAHIPFVRFADDLLLFTDSYQKAQQAKEYAQHVLQKLGLELNPEKTKVIKSSKKVIFLGEKLPDYRC
jgi:RNA-directed DNA polymerase